MALVVCGIENDILGLAVEGKISGGGSEVVGLNPDSVTILVEGFVVNLDSMVSFIFSPIVVGFGGKNTSSNSAREPLGTKTLFLSLFLS